MKKTAEKARDALVFIPCSINRASLGEADEAFVVLHDLLNSASRPAWVPKKFVLVKPQQLQNGRLAAWVMAKEISEERLAYKVAIMNQGEIEVLEVTKASVISSEDALSVEVDEIQKRQGAAFSEILALSVPL